MKLTRILCSPQNQLGSGPEWIAHDQGLQRAVSIDVLCHAALVPLMQQADEPCLCFVRPHEIGRQHRDQNQVEE